jgi:hypothetical protein
MTSTLFSQKYHQLKREIAAAIEEHLNKVSGTFELVNPFTDEANNSIVAVSIENGVHFEDMGGNIEHYPLSELGVSQPMKSKTTIDRNDLMKIERKVRRDTAIKNDIPHFGHQVHKSKKDYNRCALKRELKNLY